MKTEKTQKIAIFGGSFDPPHFAHIDIVKNLEKQFDGVIVVPSHISPFKAGATDAKTRLRLCKKVFASDKTKVLDWEIKKGGVSYSVDTASYLAKKHKGAELFWVIGTEELKKLTDWHDIDKLKTLVTFYAVPRPGFDADAATLRALKKRGITVKKARFIGLDISSTLIKLNTAFGKPNALLPTAAAELIKKGCFDPYGRYVDALYKYGVSQHRLTHTYYVALRGAELAKMYGANVNDTVVACILHDIAKSLDPDDYADKVDLSGYPGPCKHAPVGAYIAKRDFAVSDEIAHAISAHATCDHDMDLLSEILWLADKTEATRAYNTLDYQRYLCGVDKDLAMYNTINEILGLHEIVPCDRTSAALEMYKNACAGKKLPDMPLTARAALAKARNDAKNKSKDKDVEYAARVADTAAAELSLHKAHDISVIDLSGKTIIADYFVIASATSSTAVKALTDYVEDKLTKEFGLDPSKRDIDREWAALDYGCVIVHIFTDKQREFYNIERLWSDGDNITRYEG